MMHAVIRDRAKNIFLDNLAQTNRIGVAAKAAGISRWTAWDWRRRGFLTDDELLDARSTYEELLEMSYSMGHFGSRSGHKGPVDRLSGRRMLAHAKRVLPEFGGRKPFTVQYSTAGWTPEEKADIYNRIRAIQAKHPRR
jgi:hypothetical protein